MDFSIQNSILLINKPIGPTSHDIVDRVRKITGIKRVGHAGTLDPFAEGLLIVLVGREMTKRQSQFLGMDKAYEATIHLGATSTTDDCMGEIKPYVIPNEREESRISSGSFVSLRMTDIQEVVQSLVDTYDQMPPAFSAKKINGKKAYELARRGIQPDLKAKTITIHSIDILSYEWPLLTIRTRVSSGTYIRALARDIGEKLGCGAYVEKLKRTSIGPYSLEHATTGNNDVIPAEAACPRTEAGKLPPCGGIQTGFRPEFIPSISEGAK